jgi:predicted MFS family arabinose efflux permease
MKPSFPLRIIAILTALGDLGHTSGVLLTIPHDLAQGPLLEALKTHQMTIMGFTRSHWDFYVGFGLHGTISFLLVAGLAWMVGNLADADPARARPFVYLLLAAQAAGLVLAVTNFFTGPIVMAMLTMICLGWSLALMRRAPAASRQVLAS